MSKGQQLERVLDLAREKETTYDWSEAAKLYEQALDMAGTGDLLKRAEIQERLGYCFYRAAFQAETQRDFRRLIGLSAEAYEGAARLLEALDGSNKQARVSLCRAKAAYSRWWLAENPTDRTTLLDECRRLCKDAAKAYAEAGDHVGQGHACNELLTYLIDRYPLVQDAEELKNIVEEWLEYGDQAIHALAEAGDAPALARAYYQLSWGYTWARDVYESVEKQKTLQQHALSYAEQAVEVAERTGDRYLLGWANCALVNARWLVKADVEAALQQLENTLESATMTRDTYLIAWVRERQAQYRTLNATTVEDPDKRREEWHKVISAAEEAIARFELLSYPYTDAYYWHLNSYVYLAGEETDLAKKRGLAEKAVELARAYLQRIQRSGSPRHMWCMHPLSAALGQLATIETEPEEKRRLLTQAAEYREAAINTLDRVLPFDYWNRAMYRGRLPVIKVELAMLEPDRQMKRDLLTAAAVTMDETVNLIKKRLKAYATPPVFHTDALARVQDLYRGVLHQLYLVTGEQTYLEQAIKRCEDAIEAWEKVDLPSRLAETHWQMARFYDRLGEHLKAAQAFAAAAKGHTQAAAKLPQLKTFYTDHAVYMQAWSEIEKARHAHSEEEHEQAKEHYKKAADLHQATVRWNYLSLNYLAWARLEDAEKLSRRDQAEKAREYFQQAAGLFAEAKKAITAALDKIETDDEKAMVTEIITASDIRRDYCLGRIAIETARILDRQGDHRGSSRNYRAATDRFQRALDALTDESDRRELRPIVYLSRAWQLMTQAEAEASPGPYLAASQLFAKAKEHSIGEKAKVLALGHSSFCKALEAGTRFEAHRDIAIYRTAKKHLEVAANYYLKAGFRKASEYAKATQRLLDAYMYIDKAETEVEPNKKAQYYQIAEKLLHASTGSYAKTGYPEKSEEVRRLLESVEEEQQLARSVVKVLHAPTITSTTTSFSMPSPTHEEPVGLERFEHVNIQAHFTISPDFSIEEEADLRLDLVNVAKNAGLLVRVDKLVPPGFQVTASPSQHTLDDNSVDLKGKRLDPLKVESIKLRLKAIKAGVANVRPNVVYVDDVGKFRTCSLEPVTITVHPRLEFEFKTQAAQTAFAFLTRAFVQDYMQRRLSLENSGWRTLMELVRQGKLSKSSVYGARGRRGPALSELERRGLVETRIFPGGRGRGGKIQKARIAYKKETIKRYIDHQVTKIKEN